MSVDRLSITVDAELGKAVRVSASEAGTSVSRWVARALADKVRNKRLGEALDIWEAEHGAFTPEELDEAARTLGLPRRGR